MDSIYEQAFISFERVFDFLKFQKRDCVLQALCNSWRVGRLFCMSNQCLANGSIKLMIPLNRGEVIDSTGASGSASSGNGGDCKPVTIEVMLK